MDFKDLGRLSENYPMVWNTRTDTQHAHNGWRCTEANCGVQTHQLLKFLNWGNTVFFLIKRTHHREQARAPPLGAMRLDHRIE